MAHALVRLGADAGGDHLVVAPQRPIEEHQFRPSDPFRQRARHRRAGRQVEEPAAIRGDLETDRIAGLRAEARPGVLILEVERDFPGHHERGDAQPERRAVLRRDRIPAGRAAAPAGATKSGLRTLKIGLLSITPSTRFAAYNASGWLSRSESSPATWSTSPLVRTAAAIGLWRLPACGWSCGVAWICWRRSGDAFNSSQRSPSALTAKDDCVRASAAGSFARARLQFPQLQFHCGNPPPAAAPKTRICTANPRPGPRRTAERSDDDCAGVCVDLEPDRNLDDLRLSPHHASSWQSGTALFERL